MFLYMPLWSVQYKYTVYAFKVTQFSTNMKRCEPPTGYDEQQKSRDSPVIMASKKNQIKFLLLWPYLAHDNWGKVMRICMHLDGDITPDDLAQKTVHLTNLDGRVGWIAMKGECDSKKKFRNKESKQCAVGVLKSCDYVLSVK